METRDTVDKPVDSGQHFVDVAAQEAERLAAQKQRSLWLALALFGFVILIGLTSALQLKKNIQRNSAATPIEAGVVIEEPQP